MIGIDFIPHENISRRLKVEISSLRQLIGTNLRSFSPVTASHESLTEKLSIGYLTVKNATLGNLF
jgi:hypothetical protein